MSKISKETLGRVLEVWVENLTNGEYSQAEGKLVEQEINRELNRYEPVAFCCLGVLCDLASKPLLPNEVPRTERDGNQYCLVDRPDDLDSEEYDEDDYTYVSRHDVEDYCSESELPNLLWQRLGLTSGAVDLNEKGLKKVVEIVDENPSFYGKVRERLRNSPDDVSLIILNDGGFSFKQIADVIAAGGVKTRFNYMKEEKDGPLEK